MSLKKIVHRYIQNADADMLVYSGRIDSDGADSFIRLAQGTTPKPNLLLSLTTFGGDPSAAFRIASYIRRRYERVTLLVPGYCKSAGTLIAFSADEIVMSPFGEFGPLDMQIVRRDDLLHYGSGLDMTQALQTVTALTSMAFDHFFKSILIRGEGAISTTTAANTASHLSIGLFSPIVSQIDPLHLGETTRVNTTATAYAKRLRPKDGEAIVDRLINEYPSHGYCIDVDEAKELFQCVREPADGDESLVLAYFVRLFRTPAKEVFVSDFAQLVGEEENEQSQESQPEPSGSSNGEADGSSQAGDAEAVREGDSAGRGEARRRRSEAA